MDLRVQGAGPVDHRRQVRGAHQNRELVAPGTCGDRAQRHVIGKAGGHRDPQLVTGVVAQGVTHVPDRVEAEQQDAHDGIRPAGLVDRILGRLREPLAVGQAGQRVVVRRMPELAHQLLILQRRGQVARQVVEQPDVVAGERGELGTSIGHLDGAVDLVAGAQRGHDHLRGMARAEGVGVLAGRPPAVPGREQSGPAVGDDLLADRVVGRAGVVAHRLAVRADGEHRNPVDSGLSGAIGIPGGDELGEVVGILSRRTA